MAENNVYWAAKTGTDLAKEVIKRVDDHYSFAKKNDVFDAFDRAYKAYYGKPFNSSTGDAGEITAEGEQGEYLKLSVNHFANFIRHQINLVLSEKPAYKPVASTTNSEQASQAYQAGPILESKLENLSWDRTARDLLLKATLGSKAYRVLSWDSASGYDYLGTPSGDIKVSIKTVLDCIQDRRRDGSLESNWSIIRHRRNKHEVAAKWPEHKDKILALNSGEGQTEADRYLDVGAEDTDEDEIVFFELRHARTPALATGKLAIVLSEDLVLIESDLPYETCNVFELAAEDKVGSSSGHSLVQDLLSIQEALNHLYSIVFTNQKTFGIQNILNPEGSNISVEQVTGGLNFITYRPGGPQGSLKPEALNLTATPAEIFNFIQQLEKVMETLSGVNSTVRGNAPANLESGSALALLESQSKSFASGLMQNFTAQEEKAVTGLIQLFKKFATLPQKITLAGEDQTYRVVDFSSKTFEHVAAVRAERVSSVAQTTAGKMELANTLLQGGHINPQQYITVASTGRLEAMMDASVKERLHIKRNLEKWRRGEPVDAPTIVENHALHIKEEAVVLFDDEARQNGALMEQVVAHLQEHVMLLATPDPIMQNLLMVLGQQPLMLPLPPPPGGANPNGSQPKPPGNEPSSAGPAEPNLPNLPNNPATGEQWDPQTGGGVIPPVQ